MPCDVGQERNPETNRCRAIIDQAVAETTKLVVTDDVSAPSALHLPAGIVGVGVVGYAVYEWKQELRAFVSKIGNRFRKK
jgi:hypothetical protein